MVRRDVRTLELEELTMLVGLLKPIAKAMVLVQIFTSMNVAEACGLRWKRVNLTAEPVSCDGKVIPAHHALIAEQWYRSAFGSVKAKARNRLVPLPSLVVKALRVLRSDGSLGAARRTSRRDHEHLAIGLVVMASGTALMAFLDMDLYERFSGSMRF